MKTASFTVHGTAQQSARWKQCAEAEGFRSTGAWLAGAADAYLKIRARAGLPVPLAWRKGVFRVNLDGTDTPTTVRGYASPPFGVFYGTPAAIPSYLGRHRYTLVYIPSRRVIATLRSFAHCKALASELARLWYRGDGSEPAGNAAPVLSHPA